MTAMAGNVPVNSEEIRKRLEMIARVATHGAEQSDDAEARAALMIIASTFEPPTGSAAPAGRSPV